MFLGLCQRIYYRQVFVAQIPGNVNIDPVKYVSFIF
jgi:hypothetical protein